MVNAHPLSSSMVVQSFDVKKDLIVASKNGEKLLGPKVSYLSAISALMYLANCTRIDFTFSINLLAR